MASEKKNTDIAEAEFIAQDTARREEAGVPHKIAENLAKAQLEQNKKQTNK